MTPWRLLPFATGDAAGLLTQGMTLLDRLADEPTPTLRWYRASPPALVLGRGQARVAVRPDTGLAVHRRGSGGGAVLMDDRLLSLDVLLPAGHALLAGDLGAVFDRLGGVWAAALADLGVSGPRVGAGMAARRGGHGDGPLAAVCYATVGRGEVTVGGRKLVGLAQRRRRPGALVQCGLLRRWEPGTLLTALGAGARAGELRSRATGLDDLLAEPASDEAVMAAVHHHLGVVSAAGQVAARPV